MKILIINPSLWIYGGAERVISQLANYLTDRHHEVSILCYQICPEFRHSLKEARIIECKDISELCDFAKQITDDFDAINIHNEPGYLTLFPKKANVTWMCNEPPHLDNPIPTKEEIQAVKDFKVIVADEFNKKRLDELYNVNSKIIPYGIDYEFFNDNPNKIKKNKEKTFIQVGWIADTKNQLRTIEIFKRLKVYYPEAKLILVGKALPDYLKQVRDKIAEYNLMGDIEWIDFTSREQVRDLYHQSHVALFPIKSQGGWLSVFEAISAGLPTYVSEDATCSSIVKATGTGYVCSTDNDFIENVVHENHDRNYNWIKENLTWDNYCESMLEEFKK